MSKSQRNTVSAVEPVTTIQRARPIEPANSNGTPRDTITTSVTPELIEQVIELMSNYDAGTHRIPHEVSDRLAGAHFHDWHAAFVVRGAAEAGLSEKRVLRVLISQARECAREMGAPGHYEQLRLNKSEDLVSGKINLDNQRTYYELRGMILEERAGGNLFGFLSSLLAACFEFEQADEPCLISQQTELAAQRMVLEYHEDVASAHGDPEAALAATHAFVATLKAKLEAALAESAA